MIKLIFYLTHQFYLQIPDVDFKYLTQLCHPKLYQNLDKVLTVVVSSMVITMEEQLPKEYQNMDKALFFVSSMVIIISNCLPKYYQNMDKAIDVVVSLMV